VTFETNRYSAPADKAHKHLTLRAYPFTIELLADNQVIATHKRCYGRHRTFWKPLHYLSLLEQRPGAFEHAQPLRQWRKAGHRPMKPCSLRCANSIPAKSQAIRAFVQILQLHQNHAPELIQAAVEEALREGLTHPAGVRFCLNRLVDPLRW